MLRITADTNVIISGLNFAGIPLQILDLAEANIIKMAISDHILEEVTRVLRRNKFGWPASEIERAIFQILRFAEHVEPPQSIDLVKEDPVDNRILECAVISQSDYIVTGDNHLLKLGQLGIIRIVSPSDFMDLQAQGRR